MKILLLALTILTMPHAFGSNPLAPYCFSRHLTESIKINQARKAFYNELTQGASNRALNILIASEAFAYPVALAQDLMVRKYHKGGMDLFCQEFKEMNPAPVINREVPKEEFQVFDWKSPKARLKAAIALRDHEEVKAITLEAINDLKSQPKYHCMLRHAFESIYRFAHFLPLRVVEAETKGLPDPTTIMYRVMKLHLLALKGSASIDRKASPVQAKGVPMICAEIPDLLEDLEL